MKLIRSGLYCLFTCSIANARANLPSNLKNTSPIEVFQPNVHDYEVLSSKTVYERWRSIVQQRVKMPGGKVVDYDIVDQKGSGAVTIFVWDSKRKTATIVNEYNPGCHRILCGPAAGIVEADPNKHDSNPKTAAIFELEEECHLSGGTWHRLVRDDVAIPMDKYVVTEIVPYLVIDPVRVDNPRPPDAEEDIEIMEGLSVDDILKLIYDGKMNLVGGWACLLAIEKLRELREI